MQAVLERYEELVTQLGDKKNQGNSYLDRVCQNKIVFEEIKREEEEIEQIKNQMLDRTNVLSRLNTTQGTFILDHPHFQTNRIVEIYQKTDKNELVSQAWNQYLKPNHEIIIEVSIQSIEPLLKQWGNLQNQLTFDTIQFHLHHVDQIDSSKTMHYSNNFNLYHISHLVDGKIIKNDRSLSLKVRHVIRNYNINLYQQLFANSPITLVAQSNYGLIVGSAQIDLTQLNQDSGNSIKNKFICLIFRNNIIQNQLLKQSTGSFYAKVKVTVTVTPVAPEVVQLNMKMKRQQQTNLPNKSVSPKRIISKSPNRRSTSPKVKRSLLKTIVSPQSNFVQLSIYENWEYKYKLQNLNISTSKQLIYKNSINVKSRKIELIKQSDLYYLKIFVVAGTLDTPSSIRFSFSSIEYQLKILKNNLFKNIEFYDYSTMVKNDSQPLQNKIIHLGDGIYIYAKQSNRIHTNVAKLELECFMLNSLFIKSSLPKYQVFCNSPFVITEVIQKQNGLMLTYYYDRSIKRQKQVKIVFFLMSTQSNVNQIHIFDCIVCQLKFNQESLYREIPVKNEQFVRLSLKMIANQSYNYQIRALQKDKIRVVNGTNFVFKKNENQFLIIQIIDTLEFDLMANLIFFDNKSRSFCMKLLLYPQKN